MNQDPKQHWQNEVAQRRAKLDNIRRDLRLSTERFKRTGAAIDGQNVATLAGAERLAEIALDGAVEQLGRVRVVDHTQLGREREAIERRIAVRHRERVEQIRIERQRCGTMPEHHIVQHLRNAFGRYDYNECTGDREDKARLAQIDAQLGAAAESQTQGAA